ncbi:MAG: hypothetical protein GKR96_11730 [Gammaproteobacteria bacterium]|nr:hypothetical protein [Gammaproteobacteria bacterium]
MLFEEKLFGVHSLLEFRQMLAEEFPEVKQIVSNESAETAQKYYRDGLESGGLDFFIHEIYRNISRLTT